MDWDDFEDCPTIRTFSPRGVQHDDCPRIWRYMDLPSLLWMLQNEALRLTPLPDLSRFDPNENTCGLLITERGEPSRPCVSPPYTLPGEEEKVRQIERQLSVPLSARRDEVVAKVRKYREQNSNVFISCWHVNERESDFMWRIYAKHEYGFAVVSDTQALVHALCQRQIPRSKLGTGFVVYPTRAQLLQDELESVFQPHMAFMIKHPDFMDEHEFRLYVRPRRTDGHLALPIELGILIKAVHASPLMPTWAREVVVPTVNKLLAVKGLAEVAGREDLFLGNHN